MARMTRLLATGIALIAATAVASPLLFPSRVPYEPLVTKLKAEGGDASRIVRVRSARELLGLEAGKRYKFAIEEGGRLAIAPMPADAPHNEYVHPILAAGAPVRTAGGIVVDQASGKLARVTVDQDSKSYCPTLQSLDEAVRVLEKLGVSSRLIAKQDRPPTCAAR